MRRLSSTLLRLSLLYVCTLPGAMSQTQRETESFVWKYGNITFGTLQVPSGFTDETQNYTEGIVIRLHYPDGSCFLFQRGGMYRVPMFQDPEHIVDFSRKVSERTIRRGHYKGRSEVWGEVNYNLQIKSNYPLTSLFELFGPNIGYEHVPGKRAQEFARALESFRPSH
jgi:hypothetical protein